MLALLVAVGVAFGVAGLLLPGSLAAQQAASATRTLSATSVDPRGEVEVTIEADGYGDFGGVVETLPAGFSYVIQ